MNSSITDKAKTGTLLSRMQMDGSMPNGGRMEISLLHILHWRLTQRSRKGRPTNVALKSPLVELSPDSLYTFVMQCRSSAVVTNKTPKLDVELIVDDTINIPSEFERLNESEWEELVFDIPKGASRLRYQFTGTVLYGGIFIDNIRIFSAPLAANVNSIQKTTGLYITATNGTVRISSEMPTNCDIYTISGERRYSGIPLTPQPTIVHLPQGIYIFRTASGENRKVVISE